MEETNEERLSVENSRLKILLWECKTQQNNKGWKKQLEVYKSKLADRERVIEELTAETKMKTLQIQELKKVIREDVHAIPVEGCELVQVDSKNIGSYVPQKRVQ